MKSHRLIITAVVSALLALTVLGATEAQNKPSTQTSINTPYLGVIVIPAKGGAEVIGVSPESPAAQAGLHFMDVITALNHQAVSATTIESELRKYAVGDEVTMSIMRGNQTQDIKIKLAPMPDYTPGKSTNSAIHVPFDLPFLLLGSNTSGQLGVQYQPLNATTAQEKHIDLSNGVLITAVTKGSAADKAGLKVGDVVTAVDGAAVNQEHPLFDRLYAFAPGDQVKLEVQRGTQKLELNATLTASARELIPFFSPFPFQGLHLGQLGETLINRIAGLIEKHHI